MTDIDSILRKFCDSDSAPLSIEEYHALHDYSPRLVYNYTGNLPPECKLNPAGAAERNRRKVSWEAAEKESRTERKESNKWTIGTIISAICAAAAIASAIFTYRATIGSNNKVEYYMTELQDLREELSQVRLELNSVQSVLDQLQGSLQQDKRCSKSEKEQEAPTVKDNEPEDTAQPDQRTE